jgi:hypothetical protein
VSEQINKMRELANWARKETNKSSNFEINFWFHQITHEECIEYRLWIDGLINESTNCLDEIVSLIPQFKQLCEQNREVLA